MQSEHSGTSTKIAQTQSKLNDLSSNKKIITLSETITNYKITMSRNFRLRNNQCVSEREMRSGATKFASVYNG